MVFFIYGKVLLLLVDYNVIQIDFCSQVFNPTMTIVQLQEDDVKQKCIF